MYVIIRHEEYINDINKEFPPLKYRNYKRNKAKHADILREKYQQYLKDFFPEITSIEN